LDLTAVSSFGTKTEWVSIQEFIVDMVCSPGFLKIRFGFVHVEVPLWVRVIMNN
jgi:hypothetical protein